MKHTEGGKHTHAVMGMGPGEVTEGPIQERLHTHAEMGMGRWRWRRSRHGDGDVVGGRR